MRNAEKFTVFADRKSVGTVRTGKAVRSSKDFAGAESLVTDLALVLAVITIIHYYRKYSGVGAT